VNKIFTLIVILAVFAGGGYWFYSLRVNNVAEMEVPLPPTDSEPVSLEEDSAESNNHLFDLKNSIQGVIADSVQDDIQAAVEKEIKKSEEAQ